MTPDCGRLGWDPLGSAPLHSAFSGVMAGLVFAGIVLLLSGQGDRIRRTNALVVLGAAFLVLALDAFLFGVIAGERVCGRAWTETVYAAGLLGLGALGAFSGLCWLIHTADGGERRTTRFYLSITYVIALIVSYHVSVTARDYLDGFGGVPRWLDGFVRVEQWTLVAVVVAVAAWQRFRRAGVGVSHRYVIGTAYGYVGCVVVAAYMAGRSSAVPESGWQHVGVGTLAWTAIVGVTLPAAAVVAQVLALPAGRPEPVTQPAGPPEPVTQPAGVGDAAGRAAGPEPVAQG